MIEISRLQKSFGAKKVLDGIDLILSSGDLNPHYLSFLATFTTAPVLYVHGNHDDKYEKIPPDGCICIEDQIYDYLYKGEDIALKFINNANKLLQPVMLVKTADSFIIPSSSASAPTRVKASSIPADGISIYPTSYTAEIVAPAYKKLVGVTNVFDKNGNSAQGGNAACLKALENANNKSNGLAEVQYGTWNRAKLALDATPGYVYEVVYTAVDYSGRVVAKKYYIELN